MNNSKWSGATIGLAVLFVSSLMGPITVQAAGPAAIDLLSADNFLILSKTGITNTGSHGSVIKGNIGSSPITAAAMNNVYCSEVTKKIYGVDAAYVGNGNQGCFASNPPLANKTLVDKAVLDMGTAYSDAAGRTNPTTTELGGGNIGGLTFAPGLYRWSTNVTIPTNVTLSGDANDVWIFQVSGNLTLASGGSVAAASKIVLSGGAKASNIYWQVGGGSGVTVGTYATFNGNILSAKQIVLQTGAILNGRALSQTQVTLDAATVEITAVADNTLPSTPQDLIQLSTGSTNTATVRWSAATDNMGVVAYQVSVDGNAFTNVGTSLSYTTGALSQGTHTIAVRSQDEAGNVSIAAALGFTITLPVPIPTDPLTLEGMLVDANLIVTRGSRTDFETSTGRFCELSTAIAASRVGTTLGTIADATVRGKIENFTACGGRSSISLGAGERLGVVNSFRAAFNRFPSTQMDWYDVLKIANGRFPGETSAVAETRAKASFKTLYARNPNMNVSADYNAVVVMAYGLRPLPRKLSSETAAIATFRSVHGRMPSSGSDWDVVRAVAYSGATR